jgi:anti-anti-sigma factor
MFQIGIGEAGTIVAEGRLDAAQAPRAQEFLDEVTGECVLDLGKVDYISSAGLGVLLRTHKRLMGAGQGLKLVNVHNHINDIFMYSGFDNLFEIEIAETP